MAEVVTGEAVVLDLAVARFPSRILAQLLDIVVQIPVLVFLGIVVFRAAGQHLNTASGLAVFWAGIAFVTIGYPLVFETLTRGKTLGKLALGLRVVCDDGSPVRFRQGLIRALSLTFVELWVPPFPIIGLPAGLLTSMVTARGKRLGDVFAGTFVIQERVPRRRELGPEFSAVPPALADWAQHLELARLSDQTAAAASSYLRRHQDLRPTARQQLGQQLAGAVAAQVSPPPPGWVSPEDYLTAVLAVRRERELARVRARQAALAEQPAPGVHPAPDPVGPAASGPNGTVPVTQPVTDGPAAPPLDTGFAAPA